jgi:hypothetical protein
MMFMPMSQTTYLTSSDADAFAANNRLRIIIAFFTCSPCYIDYCHIYIVSAGVSFGLHLEFGVGFDIGCGVSHGV